MGIHQQLQGPPMKDVNIQLFIVPEALRAEHQAFGNTSLGGRPRVHCQNGGTSWSQGLSRITVCGRTSERKIENVASIQCSFQRLDFHSDSFCMRISIHFLTFLLKALIIVLQVFEQMTPESCQHVAGCITFPAHLDGSSPRRLYGGHQGSAASIGKLASEVPQPGQQHHHQQQQQQNNDLLPTHTTPCEMMSRQKAHKWFEL